MGRCFACEVIANPSTQAIGVRPQSVGSVPRASAQGSLVVRGVYTAQAPVVQLVAWGLAIGAKLAILALVLLHAIDCLTWCDAGPFLGAVGCLPPAGRW
jgi:hypothetical protein